MTHAGAVAMGRNSDAAPWDSRMIAALPNCRTCSRTEGKASSSCTYSRSRRAAACSAAGVSTEELKSATVRETRLRY